MSDGEILTKPGQSEPIAFVPRLAGSQGFSALFKDGMALVDETAAYLDGPGREDSRQLTRAASLAYATEAMRLTTRLMQLASWLLLQRAVNNGELSAEQMAAEKAKVKLSRVARRTRGPGWDNLPEGLRDLVERSMRLQARVRRLDGTIGGDWEAPSDPDNPVHRQLGRIAAAFACD
jgi:regulator of CtrA degradation